MSEYATKKKVQIQQEMMNEQLIDLQPFQFFSLVRYGINLYFINAFGGHRYKSLMFTAFKCPTWKWSDKWNFWQQNIYVRIVVNFLVNSQHGK